MSVLSQLHLLIIVIPLPASTRAEGATSDWNILSCSGKGKQGHHKVIKHSVNFACLVREQLQMDKS